MQGFGLIPAAATNTCTENNKEMCDCNKKTAECTEEGIDTNLEDYCILRIFLAQQPAVSQGFLIMCFLYHTKRRTTFGSTPPGE